MLLVQSTSTSVRQGPLGRFSDLLGLYQALSLVVPMQPDLEIDTELQVNLKTEAYLNFMRNHSSWYNLLVSVNVILFQYL
jgi:hypothetical protein